MKEFLLCEISFDVEQAAAEMEKLDLAHRQHIMKILQHYPRGFWCNGAVETAPRGEISQTIIFGFN